MIKSVSINKYKELIRNSINKEVVLTLKKGRKFISFDNCIITNVYPKIFIIEVKSNNVYKGNKLSICYADLLTGNAKILIKSNIKGA